MRAHAASLRLAIVAMASLSLLMALRPVAVRATGQEADAQCNPVIMQCECGKIPDPMTGQCMQASEKANMHNCKCEDNTQGYKTTGKCIQANKCRGDSSGGQNGGSQGLGDLSQLMQQLQGMLKGLGGGGGGGSGGGGQPPGGGAGSGDGSLTGQRDSNNPQVGYCTTYYHVTTPSSDPCAQYQPPVDSGLSGDLSQSLLTGEEVSSSSDTSSSQNSDAAELISSSTSGTQGTPAGGNTASQNPLTGPSASNPVFVGPLALPPGLSGDIRYSTSRVTILVNNVDTKANAQVAGFYGTDAGEQPQGTISQMCATRPWAHNFLSSIIPSTFFDSLCSLRGYKVGQPAAAPTSAVSGSTSVKKTTKKGAVKPAPAAAATTTAPVVPPKVDIWAVPAAVSLGARTTIFWNTKGVVSCTVTSPDGSFSQNTLSGGAATVPLSGATTYTISCLTPSDDHVTNYVTVDLSTN